MGGSTSLAAAAAVGSAVGLTATFPRVRRALLAGPVEGSVPGVAQTEARVAGLAPETGGVEVLLEIHFLCQCRLFLIII